MTMSDNFLYALLNTLLSVLSIICFGLFIEAIQSLIAKTLSSLYGAKAANLIINRITFIGVIHHELAHLLVAIITGAKITEVHLFKPKDDGSLGSVSYASRGPLVLRCLQTTLSSMAPTILGVASLYGILYLMSTTSILIDILLTLLALCIIIHMNMICGTLKVAVIR